MSDKGTSSPAPTADMPQKHGEVVETPLDRLKRKLTTPPQKRGPKPGSKKIQRDQIFWYNLCRDYVDHYAKTGMTQSGFLNSEHSGPDICDSVSNRSSFSARLRQYQDGTLSPISSVRRGRYLELEVELAKYIKWRQDAGIPDRNGITWTHMSEKLTQFAQQFGSRYEGFIGSREFVRTCRQRHNLNFHLAGEELEDWFGNETGTAREKCALELQELISKHGIEPSCVYAVQQTGLFYNKLPNYAYNATDLRQSLDAVRNLKSRDRVSVLVGVSAEGSKLPLKVVGKAKKPACFVKNITPPLVYTDRPNAWVDKQVLLRWIRCVFWPHHLALWGESSYRHCVLLLSCSYRLEEADLPLNLHILYLPPSVRNPCDVGIIARMKLGYKVTLVSKLIELFYLPGGYHRAAELRSKQPRGCRGVEFGGRATIQDSMNLLCTVWNGENEYTSKASIRHCWGYSGVLPSAWQTDIDPSAGDDPANKFPPEMLEHLCDLMKQISVECRTLKMDCVRVASAFSDSFASENVDSAIIFRRMIDNWIEIEDDALMIDVILEDEVEIS